MKTDGLEHLLVSGSPREYVKDQPKTTYLVFGGEERFKEKLLDEITETEFQASRCATAIGSRFSTAEPFEALRKEFGVPRWVSLWLDSLEFPVSPEPDQIAYVFSPLSGMVKNDDLALEMAAVRLETIAGEMEIKGPGRARIEEIVEKMVTGLRDSNSSALQLEARKEALDYLQGNITDSRRRLLGLTEASERYATSRQGYLASFSKDVFGDQAAAREIEMFHEAVSNRQSSVWL